MTLCIHIYTYIDILGEIYIYIHIQYISVYILSGAEKYICIYIGIYVMYIGREIAN